MKLTPLVIGCLLAVTGTAIAGPIYDQTGTNGASVGNTFAGVSWTQATAYTNVSVTAIFTANLVAQKGSGTYYLTNSIGPGTTAANEIAHHTFIDVPLTLNPTSTPVFTGLTLGPGTYYLTFEQGVAGKTGTLNWVGASGTPTTTLGIGVSANQDVFGSPDPTYAPAGTVINATQSLKLLFTVDGDQAVPEPSTGLLAGSVLSIAFAIRRKLTNRG